MRVQTRGPFSRLSLSVPDTAESNQHLVSLSDLIRLLRAQTSNLPLTILILGWGTDSSRMFFDKLEKTIVPADAVWLLPLKPAKTLNEGQGHLFPTIDPKLEIPAGPTAQSDSSLIDKAIILDLDTDSDRRIYKSLVIDLAFFPANEEHESSQVVEFNQRTGVILVDRNGVHQEAVFTAAANLQKYQWQAEEGKLPAIDVELSTVITAANTSSSEIELIGEELTHLVDYYAQIFERRPAFRSDIREVENRYADRARLAEGLIRQADVHEWPEWAIDSLPRYYVPSESGTALIWYLVHACTPKQHRPTVIGKLCREHFLEVRIEDESARFFMESIARTFEEHTHGFPYPSERSFRVGAINNALQIIEIWLQKEFPNGASDVKELRMNLLKESQIVGP